MKKNTTKPTLSPAPATKTVAAKAAVKIKPVAAPKAKPAAAKPPAPTPAPAPVTAPAPIVVRTPVPAPVAATVKIVPKTVPVRPVEPKPVVTTISARVDVGFGNALYVRGEGAGLSWDKGVLMECVGNDLWQIALGASAQGYIFKFLVNDLTWNVGPDLTVASGESVTLTPEF